MKPWPLLFLLILVGLTHATAESSVAPKEFSTSQYGHGGGSGGIVTITLRDGVLTRTSAWSGSAGSGSKTDTATPSIESWRAFRSTVDKLNIWQWKPRYKRANDGGNTTGGWEITLIYRDRKLRSEGEMRSPDNFRQFNEAVNRLFGG